MKLEVYKSLWGMSGALETQLAQIAAAGYDGVEAGKPSVPAGEFRKLLSQHKLKYIGMAFTAGADVAAHSASFEKDVAELVDYRPEKLTVHTARDSFSFDDQCRFFEAALKVEAKHGLVVGHETHRGRPTFAPWTTAALLRKFPTLKIAADFSHWTCVAESLLDNNAADVELAITRTVHIHARVGFEEGPQVTDPAAPEFASHLAKFESWWTSIWRHQQSTGAAIATLDPEFGPPGYMHTLPYTQQPVADLWNVCLWMAQRQRQVFAEKMA